jgi:hypothetical protein
MQYNVARPDVVRAVNQRWLLKFWERSLRAQTVPRWQALEAEDLSRITANLSFLEVSGSDGQARFIIRSHGATIANVYGSPDCRGRYLDEVIPGAKEGHALTAYRLAVVSGKPVYTIHDLKDRSGRLVHYERLLLPFTNDGKAVDRILASFEFVCDDGAFDSRELMSMQAAPPALRLSATIDARAPV